MRKKIQLSTVRQTADVEVVFINAALICKVINAHNALRSVIDDAENYNAISHPCHPVLNEDGKECVDENGVIVTEPDRNQDGSPVTNYTSYRIDGLRLMDLAETVLPFLTELRTALEGDE